MIETGAKYFKSGIHVKNNNGNRRAIIITLTSA